MKVNNVLEVIGNTPLVKLNKIFGSDVEVWMKLERQNPGGSIKDRIALAMIETAEKEGKINKDTLIIEPTSGNTGVGLAMVCAVKGYKLVLVMPESMSVERRKLMSAYGAEFVLTPRELGTNGAVKKAYELASTIENSWIPQQFENDANPEIHKNTTAQEILADFPEGFDYVITGVGTGGHITGVTEVLKEKFPNLKIKIESHTDSRGSDSYNLKLSDNRAKSTMEYLISKGIDPSRIESAIGYGETRLKNNCKNGVKCSEDEHFANRRSDFIVISK